MHIAVFTPTNRAEHIIEAYQSLCNQTHQDWSWVVLMNGSDMTDFAPFVTLVKPDSRVKLHYHNYVKCNIGQLKGMCCELAPKEAKIFLELDHDDWLIPTCLAKVDEACERGAGFVYSENVNFNPDGTTHFYSEQWGWINDDFTHEGKTYRFSRHFDPAPRSLMSIGFAPNHVRAWTREAYYKAGGYDKSMPVCDDLDLICRTYLAGVTFSLIPEVLYMYREHTNTYREKRPQIQELSVQCANKYFHPMIKEWCERENLKMFNLGGAIGYQPEGYISLDRRPNAAVVCDVTEGLPFPDDSVGCFRAYDFLEHIPMGMPVIKLMNEIHRCLVPGGYFLTRTPSTEGRGAWQDPTHCSFWNSNSFWYYTKKEQAQFVPEITAKFQMARVFNGYPNEFCREHKIDYVTAEMVAYKGQRIAGGVEC